MSTMLISIVVPAYDEQKYLGRSLAAQARQTYPADCFEAIVDDNGSTDGTAEVVRRYGIWVVLEPRKGVARAHQTGFAAGRGEVIASSDADAVGPTWGSAQR